MTTPGKSTSYRKCEGLLPNPTPGPQGLPLPMPLPTLTSLFHTSHLALSPRIALLCHPPACSYSPPPGSPPKGGRRSTSSLSPHYQDFVCHLAPSHIFLAFRTTISGVNSVPSARIPPPLLRRAAGALGYTTEADKEAGSEIQRERNRDKGRESPQI